MTYEQLLSYLSECKRVGDTHFSYPGNEECIFGATNQIFYNMDGKPLTSGETVFWAGYGCDIPNGAEFPSAEEFFEAPIYRGKSIKDRWDEITWYDIDGFMDPEEFDRMYEKRNKKRT